MKALSIRQPWAWLIVNGHKDIENRDWPTRFRGPIMIHASKGMTRDEYDECHYLAQTLGIALPAADQLERGGIVGAAEIIGCVTDSESPWFFGKYGFVLAGRSALPFRSLRGRLGLFDVPDSAVQQGDQP